MRKAGQLGGISNETWGEFEKGVRDTDATRAAISRAFDWPANWFELDEVLPGDVVVELRERLAAVEARLDALEGPRGGDVVPFRPRQPEPPPAAPAQPRPKAAKKAPGRKGDGRRSNRPSPPAEQGEHLED